MSQSITEMQKEKELRLEVFKHMNNKYDANDTDRMCKDIDKVVGFISNKNSKDLPKPK